jgi:hypothetical protein
MTPAPPCTRAIPLGLLNRASIDAGAFAHRSAGLRGAVVAGTRVRESRNGSGTPLNLELARWPLLLAIAALRCG